MILAAFAVVVVGSQAATITWGIGGDLYLMETGKDYSTAVLANDASAPSVTDGSYLALVYVGQGKDTFSIGDITDASVVDRASYAIDSYGAYDPWSTDTAVTTYEDGASFGIVWFDAKRNAFDYVYSYDDGSAINAAITVADMSARGAGAISSADYATNSYSAILPVSSVPEPGIACMALLGIGMMIKRRRA